MPLCAAAPPLARSPLWVGGPQGEGQCGQQRRTERQRDGLRHASPLETRKRHARKRQRRGGGACRCGPQRVAGAQPVETGPSEARFGKCALEPPPTGVGALSPGLRRRVGELRRGALPDSGEAGCAVARGHRSSFHARGACTDPVGAGKCGALGKLHIFLKAQTACLQMAAENSKMANIAAQEASPLRRRCGGRRRRDAAETPQLRPLKEEGVPASPPPGGHRPESGPRPGEWRSCPGESGTCLGESRRRHGESGTSAANRRHAPQLEEQALATRRHAGPPPPSKKARPAGRAFSLGPGGGYPPMALSSEIDTPGPMVEHSEMPFM